MQITLKETSNHIKWLGLNVCPYAVDSMIQRSERNAILDLTLKPSQWGKRKETEPICKLKLKYSNNMVLPIFWLFDEKWRVTSASRGSELQYDFCGLYIKLIDDSMSDLLSVHWTFPCPPSERYQPHWHLKWSCGNYSLAKIHFPLNHSWKNYYPDDINSYHKWLKGWLEFLEKEFPRCLQN